MESRTTTDQYMLRLPGGWRDVIKTEAKKGHRSMNAEIVAAIEVAMKQKGVQLEQPAS